MQDKRLSFLDGVAGKEFICSVWLIERGLLKLLSLKSDSLSYAHKRSYGRNHRHRCTVVSLSVKSDLIVVWLKATR